MIKGNLWMCVQMHAPLPECLFCWYLPRLCRGSNSQGQLGLGTGSGASYFSPQNVPLVDGKTATAIAAGFLHTCALVQDGSIQCWCVRVVAACVAVPRSFMPARQLACPELDSTVLHPALKCM